MSPSAAAVASSSSVSSILPHLASAVRISHAGDTTVGWHRTLHAGVVSAARTLHVVHVFRCVVRLGVLVLMGLDAEKHRGMC